MVGSPVTFQVEKLAGMGTFASGIAHDINNPLYILLAFAESILEETDNPTIHVREIIKKYRGDLTVDTKVGTGTTFTIEFPNTAII